MKVFQIGFNKCGTRSIYSLFKSAGYEAVHWRNGELARDLRLAAAEDRKPFERWRKVNLFTDIESVDVPKGQLFEGYRHFAFIHKWHPDAKFILNTRDVEDWLYSRVDHQRGKYLGYYRRHFGTNRAREIMSQWRRDWEDHHAAVRAHFAQHPGKLVEFDIVKDDVDKLVTFFRPEFDLSKGSWDHVGKTKGQAGTDPQPL